MTVLTATVAVVLAAGQGRRLGGLCKALLSVNDEPLLVRQCAAIQAAGIQRMVIVIGAQADAVKEVVAQCRDRFQGMTIQAVQTASISDDPQDSVRAAMAFLSQQHLLDAPRSGVLISLVDLPLLAEKDIAAVMQCADADGVVAVVPTSSDGQPGHPLWVGAQLLKEVDYQQSGFSLKQLIALNQNRCAESVILMPSTEPAYFTDIDTPQDVADVGARYGLTIRFESV